MPKWFKAVIAALALPLLAGCATLPDLCSYTYQPWGPCEAGFQARVFASAPVGCVGLPMVVRQCEPAPVIPPVVEPPVVPPVTPPASECDDPNGYWHEDHDYPGGEKDSSCDSTPFLWKPDGNDGNAVMVFGFLKRVVSVKAANDAAVYAGRGNGHRQAFRLPRPARDYRGPVKVVATNLDGTTTTWMVPDPLVRWNGAGVTR